MKNERFLEGAIIVVMSLEVCSCGSIDKSIKRDMNEMREDRNLDSAHKRKYKLHPDERYVLLDDNLYGEVKYV